MDSCDSGKTLGLRTLRGQVVVVELRTEGTEKGKTKLLGLELGRGREKEGICETLICVSNINGET